jgi:hypothetical protein
MTDNGDFVLSVLCLVVVGATFWTLWRAHPRLPH